MSEENRTVLKGNFRPKVWNGGPIESDSLQDIVLEGFSDADYAVDRTDRKYDSGGVRCLDGMVVGWMCQKQVSVALYTMEA